jgi:hypothetical protein
MNGKIRSNRSENGKVEALEEGGFLTNSSNSGERPLLGFVETFKHWQVEEP